MEKRDEMITMDHDRDISIFVCWSCLPSVLHNALKDVTFFATGVYCDLVLVCMCNCLNVGSEDNIIEMFLLLYSNK